MGCGCALREHFFSLMNVILERADDTLARRPSSIKASSSEVESLHIFEGYV